MDASPQTVASPGGRGTPESTIKIGVRVPPCRPLPEIATLARRAEELGFHDFSVPDSPMLWRDTFTALAVAAMTTDHITLMSHVTNVVTRQPTSLASAARTVAELAPGRFRIGVGAGDSSARLTGQRPARHAQLRDGVRVVANLLAGRPASPDAPTMLLHDPVEGVPIYLAADGPRNLALAAEIADGVITTARQLERKRATVADAVAACGRTMPMRHIAGIVTRVADDLELEIFQIKRKVLAYLQREGTDAAESAGFDLPPIPEHFALPDGTDFSHARDPREANELASKYVSDELALWYLRRSCAIGSPEEVAARLRELKATGVDEIVCTHGEAFTLPTDLVEQVGTRVLPLL